MVTPQQVQRGFCQYIDNDILTKVNGWQRWVVGAAAAAFADNLPSKLTELRNNPAVGALGFFDGQGNIDIDKLHRYFGEQASKGPISIPVPLLGPVTLDRSDVDRLAQYIKE